METEIQNKGYCFYCGQNILGNKLIALRDNFALVCPTCNTNRLIGSVKLTFDIFQMVKDETDLQEIIPLLKQIEKLQMFQSDDYEDFEKEDLKETLTTLKMSLWDSLFEIDKQFNERFS